MPAGRCNPDSGDPLRLGRGLQCDQPARRRGSRFSIVVVAEGAFPLGGDRVVQATAAENFGVERLGGISEFVARGISAGLEVETRVVVLGHVQRGGSPVPFDRILGTRFGVHAVKLIAQGNYGRMVALCGRSITDIEIGTAIDTLNRVDPDGALIGTAESLGIGVGR